MDTVWPAPRGGEQNLMARNFRELEARMPAETVAASDTIYGGLQESMALLELGDAPGRSLTVAVLCGTVTVRERPGVD